MIKFKLFGFDTGGEKTPAPPPEAATQRPSPGMEGTQAIPQGKRVLIVDDDPVFLKATAAKLQSAGFQVRTATEAPEALAALGESPADAILLDINFEPDVSHGGMGSWDGFQLMTWLRGNPAATGARIIVVSGSDSPSNRQQAQKLGAVAYFRKPLDSKQLFAAVGASN